MDVLRNGVVCHRDCIYLGRYDEGTAPNCSDISAIYYPSKPINSIPSMAHFANITENANQMSLLAFSSGAAYNQNSQTRISMFDDTGRDAEIKALLQTSYTAHPVDFYN